jgi:hypothetical protein
LLHKLRLKASHWNSTCMGGFCLIDCLYSLEQFFSYLTAVTITCDRAANLDLCIALVAFSSEGFFSRTTPAATRDLHFFKGHIRKTCDSHIHTLYFIQIFFHIASKLFNYKQALQCLDIEQSRLNLPKCSCSSSFKYSFAGHILTGI